MPTCPILLGRDAEVARLREALAGQGEVVLVSGEAGIGKTRLLREITQQARAQGNPVVWGRPEIMTTPGPFGLILDLLANISATLKYPSADDAPALAEELANPTAGQLSRAASVTRSAAARIRGILATGVPSPVIVLEDLHSVDDASLEVVFHICRTARDDNRVVLVSARREQPRPVQLQRLLDALRHDGVLTELQLAPLSRDDTRRAIDAILGYSPEPKLVEQIVTLAEGVPFFVEQLIPPRTEGQETHVAVRGTIRDIVESDLRAISPSLKDMLRAASMMDGPVEPSLIAAACDISLDQAQALARDGIEAGFLSEGDLIVFRHAIVRHAVNSLVVGPDRVTICSKLAVAMEAAHGENPAYSWQLASLLHSAELVDKAAAHALRAGRHALSLAATSDARTAFLAARAWAADISLSRQATEGLAVVELREGNSASAAQLTRQIVEILKASNETSEAAAALGRLSSILIRSADRAGAVAALDEAQLMVEADHAPALTARLMAQKANLLTFYMGRFDEAESFMDHAVSLAEDAAEDAVLAVALDGKAEISSCRGDFATAERLGVRSLEAALRSDDAEAIGRTHNNHAVRLVLHGRAQVGLEVLSTGREHVARNYGSAGVASLDVTRSWVHQMMGIPADALDLVTNLGSVWMAWKGLAAAVRAWAHMERSETVEASLVLRHAWNDAGFQSWRDVRGQETKLNPDVLEILAAEVSLQARLGELVDAAGAAEVYVEASQWSGHPAEATRAHALLAMVYAVGGQSGKATSALDRLSDLLRERPFPLWLGMRAEIHGLLDSAREQRLTAAQHFRKGAAHYAACSNLVDQARCLRRYAETLMREQQDREGIREALGRARELALSAGGLSELSRIEANLRSIGVRPRAGRPRKSGSQRVLTTREEQISALVASGATNGEIAQKLYLSEATVAGYISSALRKLDLSGRAALAAWSAKAGLL